MRSSLVDLILLCGLCGNGSAPWSQPQESPAPKTGTSHVEVRVDDGRFDPKHQKPVVYQDADLSLRLQTEGEKLTIALSKQQVTNRLPLPDEMAQVDSIKRVMTSRVVVLGMVNGDVSEVVILGLQPFAIVDKFLAYAPTVSPDGHFIAFVKFYPAHFVEDPTDKYLLYDLGRTADANRPQGISISDKTNVGSIVYPIGATNRDGDNTGVPSSEAHHIASDGFFWKPDSTEYVFGDEHDGSATIIVARIWAEGSSSVCKKDIPTAVFCSDSSQSWCGVRLNEVEFKESSFDAHLSGYGPQAGVKKTVEVQCEQFVPSHE